MKIEFVLDRAGVGRILKSDAMQRLVTKAANRVSTNIDGDTRVDEHTTDRATASVTHLAYNARGLQAQHGTLTRAAAAVGLELKARK